MATQYHSIHLELNMFNNTRHATQSWLPTTNKPQCFAVYNIRIHEVLIREHYNICVPSLCLVSFDWPLLTGSPVQNNHDWAYNGHEHDYIAVEFLKTLNQKSAGKLTSETVRGGSGPNLWSVKPKKSLFTSELLATRTVDINENRCVIIAWCTYLYRNKSDLRLIT